ncbi:unnamed protein product [Schistosoma bovis]|nr:unnamed protein product [Schistosoma bovis]
MQMIKLYNLFLLIILSYNIYGQYIKTLPDHLNRFKFPVRYLSEKHYLPNILSSSSSSSSPSSKEGVVAVPAASVAQLTSSSSSLVFPSFIQTKLQRKFSDFHDKFYFDDASVLSASNSYSLENNLPLNSKTASNNSTTITTTTNNNNNNKIIIDEINDNLQTSYLWNKEQELNPYRQQIAQQSRLLNQYSDMKRTKFMKLPTSSSSSSSSSFQPLTIYPSSLIQSAYNKSLSNYVDHQNKQLKHKTQLKWHNQQNPVINSIKFNKQNKSNTEEKVPQIKGRWWLDTIAKLLHSHPLTLSGNSRSLYNPVIEIYAEDNQSPSIAMNEETMIPWNNVPGLSYQNERQIVPYVNHEIHAGSNNNNNNNKNNQNHPSVYGWRRQIFDPISHNTAWIEHHLRQRIQRYKQWLSPKQWKQFLTDDSTTIGSRMNAPAKFNLALFEAAVVGVRRAVAECRYQFRHERWNCSQVLDDETALFGNILLKGIPQTAFIYSIINAGIVQSVAEACLNQIDNCPCNNRGRQEPFSDWQWQGCDHNIHYGRRFSRRLLDTMERGSHIRFEMNLHNNGVGRQLVIKNMERYCRCHGTSGSCTLRTCYRRTPRMRTLGTLLKHIYDHDLVQVKLDSNSLRSTRGTYEDKQETSSSTSNHFKHSYLDKAIKFIPYQKNMKKQLTPILSSISNDYYDRNANNVKKTPKKSNLIIINPTKTTTIHSSMLTKSNELMNHSIHPHLSQLVYYELINEKLFCHSNSFYHILGTKGRLCNSSSIYMNNCHHLCCGRGYITHHYYIMESCHCKFIWCCRVECQQCLVLKKVETCI